MKQETHPLKDIRREIENNKQKRREFKNGKSRKCLVEEFE